MRLIKASLPAILLAILLAIGVHGQSQFMPPQIEFVERLPNGILLKIDGKNYLAVDGDRAKELLGYKLVAEELSRQLETERKTFSEFRTTSEQLRTSEKEKYELDFTKLREEAKFYRKQYEEEKVLRETFEADVRKCGKPWLFGYRLCKF